MRGLRILFRRDLWLEMCFLVSHWCVSESRIHEASGSILYKRKLLTGSLGGGFLLGATFLDFAPFFRQPLKPNTQENNLRRTDSTWA